MSIHRTHEHPRVKSLNDNVVHGGVKGGEDKIGCNIKTPIKQCDKKCLIRTDACARKQRQQEVLVCTVMKWVTSVKAYWGALGGQELEIS